MFSQLKALVGVLFTIGLTVNAAVVSPNSAATLTTLPAPVATCNSTATPGPFKSISLRHTSWIWTGENPTPGGVNPAGMRGFRKLISTPQENNKCAVCATVVATADDSYKLFVNGKFIGAGTGYKEAEAFYVDLDDRDNVLAIEGNNVQGTAGIAATVLVHYSDGSHERIHTDETWHTLRHHALPANWTSLKYDDSKWHTAKSQGKNGVQPWGATVLPPVLSLTDVHWIWTSDAVFDRASVISPKASRFFRRTHTVTGAKNAVCATVVINADDMYTFWVNGVQVGTNANSDLPEAYHIPFLTPKNNVFAVNATNISGGAAGFIAKILVVYDDGTTEAVVTDSSWKAALTAPDGFQSSSFVDEAWGIPKDLGAWGRAPWGEQKIPHA